jgi:hypothetical protein
LDRDQILQYKLENYFSTERIWFEQCSLCQRRLSILAPNAWLALTSLICEDLARQEPVGELIRGIGPTLLFALLSDGPQLTSRWSARYASVLADDPGTAVLSLSSEGMVKRSQKINSTINPSKSSHTDHIENNTTVGLWKDMIKGWKELVLIADDSGKSRGKGILFTISAVFKEEFTLDGRSDNSNASVFRMDTVNPEQIELADEMLDNDLSDLVIDNKKTGTWDDIRELSAAFFSIDAIVDLLHLFKIKKADSILDDIQGILNLLQPKRASKERCRFLSEIKNNISASWENPHKVGIEATITDADKNDHLDQFVLEVNEIVRLVRMNKNEGDFFKMLIKVCETRLAQISLAFNENDRIPKITTLAFLYGISNRLTYNRYINQMNVRGGISIRDAQSHLDVIEKLLLRYQY